VEQHHFERSEKHHIAAGDASLMIYMVLFWFIKGFGLICFFQV